MSKFVSNENLSEFKKKCDEVYAKPSGTYPDMTVGNATKAVQDGIGNNIVNTYAKRVSGTNGFEAAGGSGTGTETVSIGNGANATANYGIAIGSNTKAGLASTGQGAIAIGNSADAPAPGSISIGQNSQASGSPAIAIGPSAKVAASGAIQIGTGTNSVRNTVQFCSYQLLDANGNIPKERLTTILNTIYPIGSIYINYNNSTSPASFLGGSWVRINDRFLYATSGSTAGDGTEAGTATVTLTVEQIPSHIHNMNYNTYVVSPGGNSGPRNIFNSATGNCMVLANNEYWTSSTGGTQAHENMPPYVKVYMWRRTA